MHSVSTYALHMMHFSVKHRILFTENNSTNIINLVVEEEKKQVA
jgi:hypothetical protein